MSLAQNPQAMAELDLGTAPGPDGQPQAAPPPPYKRGGGGGLLRGLVGNGKSVAGIVILILFLLIAVFAPVISPGDPNLITGMGSQPPSPEHWLGQLRSCQKDRAVAYSPAGSGNPREAVI